MKEVVKLKQVGKVYKVVALENRTEPAVGDVISLAEVDELILDSRRLGRLTVKIS